MKIKRRDNKEISLFRPESFISLRDAMNRLFDESFWAPFEEFSSFPSTQYPKVDITESNERIEVTADVPGMEANDIEIEVDEDFLTLSGKTEKEEEEKGKKVYRYERYCGEFYRTIPMPAKIDPDKVKASVKDGVLYITLPKTKEGRRKKIKVEEKKKK